MVECVVGIAFFLFRLMEGGGCWFSAQIELIAELKMGMDVCDQREMYIGEDMER